MDKRDEAVNIIKEDLMSQANGRLTGGDAFREALVSLSNDALGPDQEKADQAKMALSLAARTLARQISSVDRVQVAEHAIALRNAGYEELAVVRRIPTRAEEQNVSDRFYIRQSEDSKTEYYKMHTSKNRFSLTENSPLKRIDPQTCYEEINSKFGTVTLKSSEEILKLGAALNVPRSDSLYLKARKETELGVISYAYYVAEEIGTDFSKLSSGTIDSIGDVKEWLKTVPEGSVKKEVLEGIKNSIKILEGETKVSLRDRCQQFENNKPTVLETDTKNKQTNIKKTDPISL